jgi:hypothetical protein
MAALGLAGLLAAADSVGYERLQTYGRRVWIGPGDVMTLTDPVRDRIALFDASGDRPRKLGEFGEQGNDPWQVLGPHGAVVTAAGELLVADSFNHRIQSYEAAALRAGLRPALLRIFAEAGGYASGLDGPMALATRPGSDRIYVADTRGHRVLEFEADGRATGLVFGRGGQPPGDLGWPCALAFDADGRTLYVAEEWNARVSAFDAQTGALLFAAGRAKGDEPGLGIPAGLARLGDDLLVADQAGKRIVRLRVERDDHGRPRGLRGLGSWGRAGAGPGEFQYPQSVAADSRGRVYVCDRVDGRCQMFTGDGRFLGALGEEWQPPEWTAPARPPAANAPGGHDVKSGAGGFALRVRSEPEPIPLNEPFALVVERTDGAEGEAERLRVDAVMPEHRHGTNTQARVQRLDARRYRVAGLLFHMAGHWEIHFDILRNDVWERAQWDVQVD